MNETSHRTDTAPVVWCCTRQSPGGRKLHGRAYRPKPQEQRHPTRAAAEAHRADLKQRYGPDVVVCITPVVAAHPDEPGRPAAEVAS
jgi:hypothetical protein